MVTNEVLNTILSRKGVKQYKSNPVPRELLEAIVAAGIAAPNAFNRQAWHFSVITNKTLLEEIDAETSEITGYSAPPLLKCKKERTWSGWFRLHVRSLTLIVIFYWLCQLHTQPGK